ncbi:unnamed protein product [Mytilus coruscus]|uniref:VWFA domain-containing protein n=1 Tax=Mytilus coruscus TaxID=42192 RepID=A0A6J8D2U7_MYTCO|nr:unnamed protein product [Mytilus coruscus]
MLQLPETIRSAFTGDEFAFKQTPGHFNGMWTDMATEKNILKDSKGSGGIVATEQRETISKPSFESAWYDVAAQVDRIQSIQHNLQDYPVKVDVQVKIRHNNTDYIFTASRSSQRDDDSNIPYGGAVYIYNQNEIIVTFPVRYNQNSAGGLAYTGSYGLYQGPTNTNLRGPYFKGKVKARAWLFSDLPTASINMSVYMNKNLNYKELNHTLSFYPDIMSVQIKLKECSKQTYDGYIAEAEAKVIETQTQNPGPSTSNDGNHDAIITMLRSIQDGQKKQSEDIKSLKDRVKDIEEYEGEGYNYDDNFDEEEENPHEDGGGQDNEIEPPAKKHLEYLLNYQNHNKLEIRKGLWTLQWSKVTDIPNQSRNQDDELHQLGIFGAGDGWGLNVYCKGGDVSILGWETDKSNVMFQTNFTVTKNNVPEPSIKFPRKYDFSNYLITVQVRIPDGDGNNANMIFNAVGSSVATETARFGGIVFVYTTREILFWKPKSSLGHMVYIGGVWGSGLSSQFSDTVQVIVSVVYLSDHCFSNNVTVTECIPELTDLLFVIDTSQSNSNNINQSKDFVYNLVSKLTLGINEFQVAVITFSSNPTIEFDFNDFDNDKTSILLSIQTIKAGNRSTNIIKALNLAEAVLRNCSMGARGNGIMQFVVLLTDGLFSDRNQNSINNAATDFRNNGGRILSVGIGDSISHTNLLKMSGRGDYVFHFPDVEEIYNSIIKDSLHSSCTNCVMKLKTDIIIMMDTRKNQSFDNYRSRQIALEQLITKTVAVNPDVLFGMTVFSDEPDILFNLSLSKNKHELIAKMYQVNKDRTFSTINTSHALQYVLEKGFEATTGARPASRKLIILVANGDWLDVYDIKMKVKYLSNFNIEVFGLLSGTDLHFDSFYEILEYPNDLFYISDEDFSALDVFSSLTVKIKCNATHLQNYG